MGGGGSLKRRRMASGQRAGLCIKVRVRARECAGGREVPPLGLWH